MAYNGLVHWSYWSLWVDSWVPGLARPLT